MQKLLKELRTQAFIVRIWPPVNMNFSNFRVEIAHPLLPWTLLTPLMGFDRNKDMALLNACKQIPPRLRELLVK